MEKQFQITTFHNKINSCEQFKVNHRSLPAAAYRARKRPVSIVITGNRYRQWQTVRYIHPGLACSGKVWDATVERLSSKHTCYVITLPGFGGAPAGNDPHLRQWVAEIGTYIRDHHLGKPAIVGHSIGGMIGMMVAANYPEHVSKAVIVDALPCAPALQNPSFKTEAHPDCSMFGNQYSSMDGSTFRAAEIQWVGSACADSSMWPKLLEWGMASDRKTMEQVFCESMNTDPRKVVARIKCPTLVLMESLFKPLDATVCEAV